MYDQRPSRRRAVRVVPGAAGVSVSLVLGIGTKIGILPGCMDDYGAA